MTERKAMIKARQPLSVTLQCHLLAVPRSSVYARPQDVSAADIDLMRQLDELYLKWPFYGSRRLCVELQQQGCRVNRKRIQRLMRKMGLRAIYPKPRTSQPGKGHKIYPYLLRGRRVLAWRVSNTLETDACVEALEEALLRYGAPEIFNTDQGAQYTSEAFIAVLKGHEVKISMDGKGRWVDNVVVERLWRSVKYEDVYLHAYETPATLRAGLTAYVQFYNTERRHQALNRQTPDAVYWASPMAKKAA